jgi:YVTN family beta-propeller protein
MLSRGEVLLQESFLSFIQNNISMSKQFSLKSVLYLLMTASLFVISCTKDDDPIQKETAKGPYHDGVFITNEGSFMNNNGSVSFYAYQDDEDFGMVADSVYNDIFQTVNGRGLGDVVQSISLYDSLAFIVVNNSNKVEVVTSANFKEYNVITGISQPRYVVANGTTAYVSAWGDGGVVYVVNLNNFSVSSTIKVGNGPEKMLIDGDKLYVANSGGLGSDSTITIIDMNTNNKVDSLIVGGNPKSIVKAKDGSKWVLCHGIVEYSYIDYSITRETPSQLVQLNTTNQITKTIQISDIEHPSTLDINPAGDKLYFGGGYGYPGIKGYDLKNTSATISDIADDDAYGFLVEPNSGELFVFLSPTFTDNGQLKRYTSSGTLIKTYTLGIGPNGGASSKRAVVR